MYIHSQHRQGTIEIMESMLTSARIQNSLFNLKCLSFHVPCDEYTFGISIWAIIGDRILRNICNKLTSLHLNTEAFKMHFRHKTNGYPCTNRNYDCQIQQQHETEVWFPANVQEFCLKNTTGDFWRENVHSQTFPKLEHLRIMDTFENLHKMFDKFDVNSNNNNTSRIHNPYANDGSTFTTLKNNIHSLVNNGLNSFYLTIDGIKIQSLISQLQSKYNQNSNTYECIASSHPYSHHQYAVPMTIPTSSVAVSKIVQMMNALFSINNSNNNNSSNDGYSYNDFIVKLELNVDAPYIDRIRTNSSYDYGDMEPESNINELEVLLNQYMKSEMLKLCKEINFLYNTLDYFFENVMLGVKISIHFTGGLWRSRFSCADKTVARLKEMIIENTVLFSSNRTRTVETAASNKSATYPQSCAIFAMVIKNKNKGESNKSCQDSHMEPKFRYHCQNCQPKPWLE